MPFNMNKISLIILTSLLFACQPATDAPTSLSHELHPAEASDYWKNAIVYFLLTDRFYNGDSTNDLAFERTKDGAVLRTFEGGDIKGITQKIKEGYFSNLGVNAIWMTPVFEQIKGSTDEGTGKTWAYHGYWTRDWTSLDPNFGTEEDLAELVTTAHHNGIKILLDIIINHTGPVTDIDSQWPDSWVRTKPKCVYTDYKTTVECTLVDNLPDIRTESDDPVDLPEFLRSKWNKEGRLETELARLDEFFANTEHPRASRFYIMKWITDWIRKYGIDGFRIDTAKHTEAYVWAELKKLSEEAFEEWKKRNPEQVMDDESFYMVGEVYNYFFESGRDFNYGDQSVDFFDYGFESLINFSFKGDANKEYEELFTKYSNVLAAEGMSDISVLNYISSHDDGQPFDKSRERTFESGTKLLLCPGGVQVYYGDETARKLIIEGTEGDATLRSNMNWSDLENDQSTGELLSHWQKLGQFRNQHLSVGAGIHQMIQSEPYVFKRTLRNNSNSDEVVVGLDLPSGRKSLPVQDVFENGEKVMDYYSKQMITIENQEAVLDSPFELVLLGRPSAE